MKKTFALFSALLMLSAAGCGSIDDDTAPAAEGENVFTAAESSQEPAVTELSDSSEDGNSSEPADSQPDRDEPAAAVCEVPMLEGVLNDDNCIVLGLNTDEREARHWAELAADQYDRIAAQDRQGYYDSFGIPALLESDCFLAFISGRDCKNTVPETSLCEAAFSACADTVAGRQLAEYYAERGENKDEFGGVPGEFYGKVKDTIKELRESFTIDDAAPLFAEGSAYAALSAENGTAPDDFAADPSKYLITPDADALYIVDVFEKSYAESAVAAEFDLYVLCGDIMYVLGECSARTGYEENLIYVGSAEITSNRFAGKTADELRALFEEHSKPLARRNAVRMAYNTVRETVFHIRSNEDIPWESVITDGDFGQAYSAEGLDISAEPDDSQATGDYSLLKYLQTDGFTEGRVFVELTKESGGSGFLVRYTDPDGETAQYPDSDGRQTLTELCGLDDAD